MRHPRPRPPKRLGCTQTVSWQRVRGRTNRRDDLRVCRAATEVAAHPFAYLGRVVRVALSDASDGRHDLARAAEPALESVVVDERLLDSMKLAFGCQALDRRDLA